MWSLSLEKQQRKTSWFGAHPNIYYVSNSIRATKAIEFKYKGVDKSCAIALFTYTSLPLQPFAAMIDGQLVTKKMNLPIVWQASYGIVNSN